MSDDAPRRLPAWALAAPLYLALGVLAWGQAWAGGAARAFPGGLDATQDVWWFGWALHALQHGLDPFYSRAVFAPGGLNVLANTSVLVLGVLLAPVTAVFGPIASFNVAVTLAPAASATAACYAIGREVAWRPAAVAAGICFGFGPFVMTDLQSGHLNVTFLALLPLVFVALDRLLVRQGPHPLRAGLALGVLAVLQFFISTELEVLTALVAACGMAALAIAHPDKVRPRLRAARSGIAVAVAVPTVLLAYPAWYAVAGAGHVNGAVWPNMGGISATVLASVVPTGELPGVAYVSLGNGAYLGVTLLLVLVAGVVACRHDRAVRAAAAATAAAFVVSLGYTLHVTKANTGVPLPSWVMRYVPVLQSVAPSHFGPFVDLFAGTTLALLLDRAHRAAAERPTGGRVATGTAAGRLRRAAPASLAVAAIVPIALAAPWPYRVARVAVPAALGAAPLAAVPPARTVLEYPPDGFGGDTPMLWQALSGIPYALHDGYGIRPAAGGGAQVFGGVDAVTFAFAIAQLGKLRAPVAPSALQAIRAALARDAVGVVAVVPGSKGSAVVVEVLSEALGPPAERFAGGGGVWVVDGG